MRFRSIRKKILANMVILIFLLVSVLVFPASAGAVIGAKLEPYLGFLHSVQSARRETL